MHESIPSSSPYAPLLGFSAAVKVGSSVFVSGTVGRRADGSFADTRYEQAKQALANIEAVLRQAGGGLEDVVRTRIYVLDVENIDDVAQAHREAFAAVPPAATLVKVAGLAADTMLIEIEVDACIEAQAG
jgi:enamine deaminase RidA (YjgF/YER057c/UK114 family)